MHEIITSGFLFPNEIEVHWSIMIVLYPYITGLVAGAFIVSSLYHVFNVKELKPIARFSLVSAFCFLIFFHANINMFYILCIFFWRKNFLIIFHKFFLNI